MSQKINMVTFFAFLSGMAALIYQIIWIREFSLVFGVHIFSVSAVLSAFMAGLAIGSYWIGKLADKIKRIVILFAGIEVVIALFGIFFEPLLRLATKYYLLPDYAEQQGYVLSHAVRFIISFLILIVPTTLMGGIIPLLSKLYVNKISVVGKKVSLIYGLNNLGAFLGAFLGGFVLIRWIGVQNSIYLAAGLNITNALIAISLYKKWPAHHVVSKEQSAEVTTKPGKLERIALIVFAVEGFTTLAYEVIWTRILQEFAYEKTVYFNTSIILSFIAGLGIGSLVIKNRIDRLHNPFRTLSLIQILIGVSTFVIFILFLLTSPAVHSLRYTAKTWTLLALVEYGYYFILLILPALLMGMTFPLMAVIYNRSLTSIGRKIGVIGFLDTIGSVFGSIVAGFLLLPLLGTFNSLMLIIFINILAGLWLLHAVYKSRRIYYLFPATVILWLLVVLLMPDSVLHKGRNLFYPNEIIIAYEEGISANVAIYEEDEKHLALAINGAKTAFSNIQDLKVHKMLTYVPLIHNMDADNALVIGYGMGVTTNELLKAGINDVEIAELSPEVVKLSSQHFAFLLDAFSKITRPKLVLEDGRSYLLRSEKKYDIITSNAIHSRLGVNLYTREFYEIAKSRLTPDGVVCQWLPTNWLEKSEFKSLMHAFYEVFPHSQLWFITRGHCLLVGSKNPAGDIFKQINNMYDSPEIKQSLYDVEISNPAQFLSHLFMDARMLDTSLINAPVNTDNFPLVEFSQNVDLKPSISILKYLKIHHSGFMDYVEDSSTIIRIRAHNHYLLDEINLYIQNYSIRE